MRLPMEDTKAKDGAIDVFYGHGSASRFQLKKPIRRPQRPSSSSCKGLRSTATRREAAGRRRRKRRLEGGQRK